MHLSEGTRKSCLIPAKLRVPQISKKTSMLNENTCMTVWPFIPRCVSSHVTSTSKSLRTLDSMGYKGSPLPGLQSCSSQCAKQAEKLSCCLGPAIWVLQVVLSFCHPPQHQQTADAQFHQHSVDTGELNHDPRMFLNPI